MARKGEMTSRERVLASVRHEEPDRVPYNLRPAPEVCRAFQAETGLTDFDEIYVHRTRPFDSDSDDDLFNDGHEVAVGTDPNDNTSFPASTILTNQIMFSAMFQLAIEKGIRLPRVLYWPHVGLLWYEMRAHSEPLSSSIQHL